MNNVEMNYWSNFYKNNNLPLKPSSFAQFINNYFKDLPLNILDCGCGNGRDAYYLGEETYNVVGIDTANKPNNYKNTTFILGDFCNFNKENFDLIYSRFTFHSITNEQQELFIKSINEGSYLCIETRSDKSKNINKIHGDNHFRNYTNKEYLENLLIQNKFKILYIEEDRGFAKYKDEDPICIRVISKKINE